MSSAGEKQQRRAHLIKPAELRGRRMQRKYFHVTRASPAAEEKGGEQKEKKSILGALRDETIVNVRI